MYDNLCQVKECKRKGEINDPAMTQDVECVIVNFKCVFSLLHQN